MSHTSGMDAAVTKFMCFGTGIKWSSYAATYSALPPPVKDVIFLDVFYVQGRTALLHNALIQAIIKLIFLSVGLRLWNA